MLVGLFQEEGAWQNVSKGSGNCWTQASGGKHREVGDRGTSRNKKKGKGRD